MKHEIEVSQKEFKYTKNKGSKFWRILLGKYTTGDFVLYWTIQEGEKRELVFEIVDKVNTNFKLKRVVS